MLWYVNFILNQVSSSGQKNLWLSLIHGTARSSGTPSSDIFRRDSTWTLIQWFKLLHKYRTTVRMPIDGTRPLVSKKRHVHYLSPLCSAVSASLPSVSSIPAATTSPMTIHMQTFPVDMSHALLPGHWPGTGSMAPGPRKAPTRHGARHCGHKCPTPRGTTVPHPPPRLRWGGDTTPNINQLFEESDNMDWTWSDSSVVTTITQIKTYVWSQKGRLSLPCVLRDEPPKAGRSLLTTGCC